MSKQVEGEQKPTLPCDTGGLSLRLGSKRRYCSASGLDGEALSGH